MISLSKVCHNVNNFVVVIEIAPSLPPLHVTLLEVYEAVICKGSFIETESKVIHPVDKSVTVIV